METPIIHWHTHWKQNQPIFQNYARSMDRLMHSINSSYLKSSFAKVVKKTYNLSSNVEALAILRAAKMLREDGDFKKAFDKAFEQFAVMKPFSQYGLKSTDFKNVSKRNAKKIEEYLNGVKKGYDTIAEYLGMKDVKSFYKAISTMQNVEEVRNYFQNLFDKKQIDSIHYTRFKELDAAAQGKLRAMAPYFKDIDIKKLKNPHSGPKLAEGIVNNINSGMRQIIGFGWEHQIAELNNQILPKALGPNAYVEHYGDTISNDDFEYHRATTDIRFHGGQGKIQLSLPLGASVKVANEGDRTYLSLKNSTTLGKMFNILNSTMGFMNNEQYEAFANLTTNFRKPKKNEKSGEYYKTKTYQDGKAFEYHNMNNLFRKLNKVLTITGLAGSLTPNDISTLFIINNKILNIYDVLEELGKPNNWQNIQTSKGLTFGSIGKVAQEHHFLGEELSKDEQKTRSLDINQKLLDLNLDLRLSLSRALLEKLSKI